MSKHRSLLWLAVIAGAAGLVAGQAWQQWPETPIQTEAPAQSAAPASLAEGDPIPPLSLPDLAGNTVELAAIAPGRALLINVWASWCGPCVEEMPELERFAQEQGQDGVQVVGLALDTSEAVTDFLRQVPVSYPIVLDTPGPRDASVALGNARGLLPYTVLVSPDGRLLRTRLGPFASGEIAGWAQLP